MERDPHGNVQVSLIETEKTVAKEIEESGRVRGGNDKKAFEDGINFN